MALMNWNEHFVTGIEIIDSQHLGLVKMINDSAPILALAYKRNPAHADKLLDKLTDYAVFHFKTEGDLIRKYEIDSRHTTHHFSAHKEFADSIGSMRALYQRGETLTGGTLLNFLANWLVFHILGEDQSLARQIRAIEAGATPAEAYDHDETCKNDPTNDALTQALIDLYALMTSQNQHLLEMNNELQEHRDHLEDQIKERTRQLELARDAAESANRAKSAFISNMSHEIRTPMNAIVGLTWVLHEQISDPLQKGKLQQVRNATQQLLAIINDLLDMSSIESEQLLLEPLDFDIKHVVEHAVAAQTVRAEHKGLRLTVSETPNMPALLHGDPVRIGQIISNFLSNAIKFTTEGEIKLELSLTPATPGNVTQLRCAVRDQGIGIAPEQIASIFQPFQQADPTSRRRFGGTGLGLAISKRLVDMMGGEIGVDSEINKGSIFWFKIPLTVTEVRHEPVATPEATIQAPSASPSIDTLQAREVLQHLINLLAEDDIQALTLWREKNALLRPALGQSASRLEGELNNYNFEAALALAQATLDNMP
jgi:hemerythrin-like metal-binding protein